MGATAARGTAVDVGKGVAVLGGAGVAVAVGRGSTGGATVAVGAGVDVGAAVAAGTDVGVEIGTGMAVGTDGGGGGVGSTVTSQASRTNAPSIARTNTASRISTSFNFNVGKTSATGPKSGALSYGKGEAGAEDGIRTHDPLLGKEMLYH